jgi:metal-sulfur cluster biosynthetic enzyme
LVRDAEIDEPEENVKITMIMTTPFCPYAPALLEMTRQKGETGTGIPTQIEMGTEMWDLSMMEEGAGAEWGLF